jgi:dephospho-CoA kinase
MKTFKELQEGVYDPNIFKAIFLAGGPGSGKSYVTKKITGGLGLKIVNSDPHFEKLIKGAGLSLNMPDAELDSREPLRLRAKEVRDKRKANYLEGRLGIIIDGTGKDADDLISQSNGLLELGYDTYMIFVNTSVDVALKRNAERSRSVPTPIVVNAWKAVQNNIGRFSQHFTGGNFIVVDNNDVSEDELAKVQKIIRRLVKKKVSNTRATNWISMELAKKRR